MSERSYHSPDPDMHFYDDAASAVGFYDKQQQRLFSEPGGPGAPDQPLDFSTKRRNANGGCHRGAVMLPSSPYERKVSQDSGIDGCVPSAIDFRLRKEPYPRQQAGGAPTPRTTPPTLASSFADDLLLSRSPSPRSCGADAASRPDDFGVDGERKRTNGSAKTSSSPAAVAVAAAHGAAYPGCYSPFLSAELQASAVAAAAACGYGGTARAATPSGAWQMTLNPVAAAAAALMGGGSEAKLPPRSGGCGQPAFNGSAVARLAAKACHMKEVGLPPLPPLAVTSGYYAVPAAAAFPSSMSSADCTMTVQAIRNQSEELFSMYKLQLLESHDKQKRAVREATSRLSSPATRRASAGGAKQRRRRSASAVPVAEIGDKQPDCDGSAADGDVSGSISQAGQAGALLPASLKDVCSSTCSRSSMTSDGGESQAGSTTSAAASPSVAPPSGGGGGGPGAAAAGEQPEQSSASARPSSASRKRSRPVLNDEQKDVAYWERRRKNNEAAKRSRDARRAKEDEIAIRAAFLEQENLRLRVDIASLKQEADQLRCLLYSAS